MASEPAIEVAKLHLFDTPEQMHEAGLTSTMQARLLRLREVYTYWMQFPLTPDRDIAQRIIRNHGVMRTQAYQDIRIIKAVLGDIHKTTKEYHRYKFLQMIEESYNLAKANKDAKSMVAAADKYAKYTQLDKEDLLDRGFDKIQIQPFKPTDDPSVAGFKPIPNIREKIQAKIKSYWSEEVEDVEYEAVDFNADELFHPKQEPDDDETD